jgi:hypothetical protein
MTQELGEEDRLQSLFKELQSLLAQESHQSAIDTCEKSELFP